MGIEKMTLIDINGNTAYLDKVLALCLKSGLFQPESAAKLSEYSVGQNPLMRNPYGGLLVKATEIAGALDIPLAFADFSDLGLYDENREQFLKMANEFLDAMRTEYPELYAEQTRLRDKIAAYTSASEMLAHTDGKELNFDLLWQNRFLQIRFGRLPTTGAAKLKTDDTAHFEWIKLDEAAGVTWCIYFTADQYADEVDKLFATYGFERLRVPSFVHGTSGEALDFLRDGLKTEREGLEQNHQKIDGYVAARREALLTLYCKIKFLHEAYELRRFAVSIRDHFHFIGFVPTHDKDEFLKLFDGFTGISVKTEPAGADPRLSVPVKLKNNLFTRAFEMFIEMYGSPSYGDIDPTPFVAYTYTILFGIMFGDLGHGLCVLLVGFFMWYKMKMPLGRILQRVGVASMFFGVCYGSVFGFEHLLDPLFHALGFSEKPIEIMHPNTTNVILVAAIALGVVIILSSMLFNIIIGIKKRDYERIFLSANGVCGFLLYASVLVGAVMTFLGKPVFSWWYGLFLITLPLVFIFFREPITRWAHLIKSESEIHNDTQLTTQTILDQKDFNITELFGSQFMTARFGRIPTDSYQKLNFYANEPFMLYPVKTDEDYIWLIYAMSVIDKAQIDAIFQDLFFERIFIPDEDLRTADTAAAFIQRCLDERGTPKDALPVQKQGAAQITRRRSVYERLFPDGFGAFFMETFFEMFEVILSFVSNTVSFLRVGGFVLVHAGMMSVVFTMANMASGGASMAILVFGNLFVMVLEGLLVGIQVLRLEFYEIFSRFYDATGEPFVPASVEYTEK